MKPALAVVLMLAATSAAPARQPDAVVTASLLPERAAGKALMACVAHALGMMPIAPANAQALAAKGLVYTEIYPAFMQARAQNEFGRGSFAHVASTEGQIWVTGYDSGACIFSAIGTPDGPVVRHLEQMFAIPGGWKPQEIKQLPGTKWSGYVWKSSRAELTAQMSVTDLPPDSPAKGFVSVTIAPKSMADK